MQHNPYAFIKKTKFSKKKISFFKTYFFFRQGPPPTSKEVVENLRKIAITKEHVGMSNNQTSFFLLLLSRCF